MRKNNITRENVHTELKYQKLFENSPFGISLIDITTGKYIDCNSKIEEMSGYRKEELIGHSFVEISTFLEKDYTRVGNMIKQVNTRKKTENREFKLKRKDGSTFWATISLCMIKLKQKKIVQVLIQDIDQMKKAEKRLKESEQKYRLITNNVLDLIAVVDNKFRYEYINEKTTSKLMGYSAKEILGRSTLDFVHPKDKAKAKYLLSKGFHNEEGEGEVRFKHKDGHWEWLQVRGATFRDQNGKMKGLLISRIISDQKRIQKQLKESEKRFRTLYENINGGMLIIGEDYRIKDLNQRTCEITGYKKDELIGKMCDILCPKGFKARKCLIWVKGKDGFQGMDTTIKCKDGTQNPILKNAKLITLEGKQYILENFQDIKKNKEYEQRLIQSEKNYREAYQKAEFFKDLFMHDANNILQNIHSALQLLNPEHSVKNIISSEDCNDLIETEVQKGFRLIKNVRALSKVEKSRLKPESMNIMPLLFTAIKDINKSKIEQDISINLQNEISEDIKVLGGNLLIAAFDNIFNNAMKYNEQEQINIDIIVKNGTKANNRDFISIEISDNGIGIPDKKKDLIFKGVNKKVSDSRASGMGIGLSLVKKIINAYHGKIFVKNRREDDFRHGSTFIIQLKKVAE